MARSNFVPFNGTFIRVSLGEDDNHKHVAMSDLSRANPAVMTISDNPSLDTGDLVKLECVDPAYSGTFIVKRTSSSDHTTFELIGLDTTHYPTGRGSDYYTQIKMGSFCDVTNLEVDYGSKTYTDKTTNCDTYPYKVGKVESGEIKMDIISNLDSEIQTKLREYFFSDETFTFQFYNKGWQKVRSYPVSVASFRYSASANEDFKGSVTFKMRGEEVLIMPGSN